MFHSRRLPDQHRRNSWQPLSLSTFLNASLPRRGFSNVWHPFLFLPTLSDYFEYFKRLSNFKPLWKCSRSNSVISPSALRSYPTGGDVSTSLHCNGSLISSAPLVTFGVSRLITVFATKQYRGMSCNGCLLLLFFFFFPTVSSKFFFLLVDGFSPRRLPKMCDSLMNEIPSHCHRSSDTK